MGTRGFVGFVADDQETITYNHWDAYPSGVGGDVLEFVRRTTESRLTEEITKTLVTNLKHVSDDVPPTRDQVVELAQYADLGVSKGNLYEEWYGLLRETQGRPDLILECGYAENMPDWPLDSLFCEWGYVVDFDRRAFDVYRGFQQSPPTDGRWVGHSQNRGYYPVNRVASYSFDSLPTREEFIAQTDPEDSL